MNTVSLKAELINNYRQKMPTFIMGSPAVGKSDTVRSVREHFINNEDKKDFGLIDIRLSMFDAVEFRGLPYLTKEMQSAWATPDFLPREGEGILFLDEFNSARHDVQVVGYQLLLDRRIGDYYLPDGWVVVGAGNKSTDRAIVNKMSTANQSRFSHLVLDADLDSWVSWAIDNKIDPMVIAFLRFRPALLHDFRPELNHTTYPAPRTWAMLSKRRQGEFAIPQDKLEIYSGIVGEGASADFMSFEKIESTLPDIDALIKDPKGVTVPKDPAVVWALCGALASRSDKKTINNILIYAKNISPEYGVYLVKDALAYCPDIAETKAFRTWAQDNADVLI